MLETAIEDADSADAPILWARAVAELGVIRNQSGEPAEASAWLSRAIGRLQTMQPGRDRDLTLASLRARRARSSYLLGSAEAAIEQATMAAELQSHWLSAGDPEHLFTRLMATSYKIDTADAGGSLDAEFRDIIEGYREHSPDHYGYFFAWFNYAYFLEVTGQAEQIEQAAAAAVELARERFGEEHQWTASALYRLSGALTLTGDFQQALTFALEALHIREKLLGDHHDTYASTADIGNIYRMLGDYERALGYFERALAMARRVFTDDHFSVPDNAHRRALVLAALGRTDEAADAMVARVRRCRRALGRRPLAYPGLSKQPGRVERPRR